jgi:hypothetical protein
MKAKAKFPVVLHLLSFLLQESNKRKYKQLFITYSELYRKDNIEAPVKKFSFESRFIKP